jgi:hypothetical protein
MVLLGDSIYKFVCSDYILKIELLSKYMHIEVKKKLSCLLLYANIYNGDSQ